MSLTTPTVTGFSGFWNLTGDRSTYAYQAGQARQKRAWLIARAMRAGGMRDARAAFGALIGAAAGGTATGQWSRRAPQTGPDATVPVATGVASMGGNITIETATAINRATTAADITELKKWVYSAALLAQGITYPTVTGPNISQGTQLNGVTRF